MWQRKGQHRKQCDHDYVPSSKNVHGSVSMQSHKENSLGQSPRSILERWNSSQSQSHPAPAPAATVSNKKGNKSKQGVPAKRLKMQNGQRQRAQGNKNRIPQVQNSRTLENNLLQQEDGRRIAKQLSLQNEHEENRRTRLFNIILTFSMLTEVNLHCHR